MLPQAKDVLVILHNLGVAADELAAPHPDAVPGSALDDMKSDLRILQKKYCSMAAKSRRLAEAEHE